MSRSEHFAAGAGAGKWTVEVDLALKRPPTVQRTSRVMLNSCCAHHAELTAISMATQSQKAAMPVGSRIIDWPA